MGLQSFIEKLTGTASGGITPLSRATLSTPAANVGRIYSAIPGTIVGLDVYAPAGAISGDWTFNFFVNGVPQFVGGARMTVNSSSRHATKTGLSIAVVKDDLLTFDLQVAGSGPLFGPLQFTVIIDDGQELTALVAGDGISIDDTDPTAPIITNDGVIEIAAGTGIAVDNTDPQNPIVSTTGGTSNSWDDTIVKAATESRNNTTTYADDSDLLFTVDAGGVYAFEAYLHISCANNTVTGKFRFNVTQTAQQNYVAFEYNSSMSAAPMSALNNTQRFETTASDRTIGSGGFFNVMRIKGTIKGHATLSSVFSIQWAQNAGGNANNLNVELGSWLSYKKA